MATLEGGCACGRTRYRMNSPPMFVNCCHCLRCQRETGGAFVINGLIETDRLGFNVDQPTAAALPTDSGRSHRVFRCQHCGTALASEYGGQIKLRFLRIGTLDEPHALAPGAHVMIRSKVPWVTLPPNIPAFEGLYDAKSLWPADSLARRTALFA